MTKRRRFTFFLLLIVLIILSSISTSAALGAIYSLVAWNYATGNYLEFGEEEL